MPFGRKGSARKAAKGKNKGQEGQEGRPRADAAEGAQPARRGGMPAGFPDLSQHAEGPRRAAARPGRLRPVQAEVPRHRSSDARASACTCAAAGCPTGSPSSGGSSTARSAPNRSPTPTPSFDGGWILPGLVDAHCHVGLGAARRRRTRRGDRAGRDRTRRRRAAAARRRLADRHPQPRRPRRPAPHHPGGPAPGPAEALPAPGSPIDLEDESQLPDAVAEQARWGDGWVKLVGDWIDRDIGDLAPLWSDDVLKAGDRRRARRRRPGHRARVRRGRAARPDQRGHRLHRARHRPHRRHHRR